MPSTRFRVEIQPLRIARLDHVQLLLRALADIADEDATRRGIAGHAMRIAQPNSEEFLQGIRLANERIWFGMK